MLLISIRLRVRIHKINVILEFFIKISRITLIFMHPNSKPNKNAAYGYVYGKKILRLLKVVGIIVMVT